MVVNCTDEMTLLVFAVNDVAPRISISFFPLKKVSETRRFVVGMIKEVSLELETYRSNILLLNRRCVNLDLKDCDIDCRNSRHTVCRQFPSDTSIQLKNT